jgi:hypothetical protein
MPQPAMPSSTRKGPPAAAAARLRTSSTPKSLAGREAGRKNPSPVSSRAAPSQ